MPKMYLTDTRLISGDYHATILITCQAENRVQPSIEDAELHQNGALHHTIRFST